ncbi:hypothetical protein OIU84_017043 [Salix udensis]|uniref:Uncharacterized protein n=1 Tax=Salix udensis TaxID=889485 RepID=A0AAD6L146_9ROSI|nr:hypothetical protein OIU84_017043 [Salix udensis]
MFAADFCGIYIVLYHARWAQCGQIHIFSHSVVFPEDCCKEMLEKDKKKTKKKLLEKNKRKKGIACQVFLIYK